MKNLWVYLIILLGLWSCGPRVSSSSKEPNLNRYRTYAWMTPDVKTGDNPKFNGDIIDNTIKTNVDQEMAAKGYVLDSIHPDMYVTYHTYTEQKTGTTGGGYYASPYMGYGWGGYYGYGGGFYSPPYTYNYTEGTIVLDFIDAQSHQTIWRSAAEGDVDNTKDLSKKIDKGIHSMFKKVPEEDGMAKK